MAAKKKVNPEVVETPVEVGEAVEIAQEKPTEAKPKKKVDSRYYPAYKGKSSKLTDALVESGDASNYEHRKEIARANGMDNYLGLGSQNVILLNLMRDGKLLKVQ